ncbi:MAG: AsmA family protein [Alphaproteobacteria bacterium]|nr:AsmA family protein [Alphaproteobacteria bacterium]
MRTLKKILLFLFVVIVLIAAVVTIFLLTFDLNRYKNFTEQKLTTLLNRPVTIESMETKLALIPTISITGFKIANNEPFADKEPLIYIKKMEAVLELAPLLVSQVNIHQVDIEDADVHMFKTDKANNWHIDDPKKAEKEPHQKGNTKADNTNLNLRLIQVKTLNLNYQDGKNTQQATIKKLDVKDLHVVSGEVVYNKQTLTFTLNMGSIFDLLNQKPNFPLDLRIQSRIFNVTINGKIGDFKEFNDIQTTIALRTVNLKNMLNFLQISHPMLPLQHANLQLQLTGSLDKMEIKKAEFNIGGEKDFVFQTTGNALNLRKNPTLQLDFTAQLYPNKLSEFWGVPPITAKGDLELTKTSAKTKKITLDANRSDMRLSGDVQWGKNAYKINGALASDFLDLDDFKRENAAKSEDTSTSKKAAAWENIKLPWAEMKKISGNVSANIAHLHVGDTFTNYISIVAKPQMSANKLNMPFTIGMLDGQLTGTLSANAALQRIALNAKGTQLNLNGLRPINQEVQDVVLLTSASLETKGTTLISLLKALNGKVVAQTNQGKVLNKWFNSLPKALNLTQKKQNSVAFSNTDSNVSINCAAANLKIVNGVLTGNEQIALETSAINMVAGGTVNLVKKTMDVTLWPTLPDYEKTDDLLSLSKLIRISGPFNKLTPSIDTQQATNKLIETGLLKLAGVKNTPTAMLTGTMCKNVLGKDAIQQQQVQQKTVQKKTQTTTPAAQQQKTPTKQEFQQQLLDTLFQALSK